MWMCLYRGVPLTRGLSPCCSQGLFFYSNCMNLPICFQGPVLCFQGMCERNQSIVLCVTNKVLQKYSSKNPHRSTHTQKKNAPYLSEIKSTTKTIFCCRAKPKIPNTMEAQCKVRKHMHIWFSNDIVQ